MDVPEVVLAIYFEKIKETRKFKVTKLPKRKGHAEYRGAKRDAPLLCLAG